MPPALSRDPLLHLGGTLLPAPLRLPYRLFPTQSTQNEFICIHCCNECRCCEVVCTAVHPLCQQHFLLNQTFIQVSIYKLRPSAFWKVVMRLLKYHSTSDCGCFSSIGQQGLLPILPLSYCIPSWVPYPTMLCPVMAALTINCVLHPPKISAP